MPAGLIPEDYGGSGLPLSVASVILEEIQRGGCNGAACHAQMYMMGTLLNHGSAEQKRLYLPKIASGELRLQAFGVTEPESGTDTTSIRTFARREGDHFTITGQKLWTSRAEHSDLMLLLARTTPRDQVAKRTDGLSVFIVDMANSLGQGMSIKPIRTMMNHATTEVFFDGLKVPARNLIGEEGKGFRYILSGMNAERILIGAECIGDAKWFIEKAVIYAKDRVVFGRPIGQNQGIQFPIAKAYANLRAAERRRAHGREIRPAVRRRQGLRIRSEYGEDARGRCCLGSGECLYSDPWRLRFRRGFRHRAQVPGNPALSGCSGFDQSDPGLSRRACSRPAAFLLRHHDAPAG